MRCNYCTFKDLQRRAEKVGATVITQRSEFQLQGASNGVDVYVVPAGETWKREEGENGEQWRCWYAELPDHCAC